MKDLSMNLRLLVCGVLLVFLAACAPPPNLRDTTMWQDTSLITNEPCTAPCWQGITPGETTWSAARVIVEDLQGRGEVQEQNQDGQIGAVWQSEGSEQFCCAIVSNSGEAVDENDVVNYVQVRLAPGITLGDLIEVQGEPAYVVNGEAVTEDQAYIVLLYPNISTIVYAFVGGAESGILSASSEIVFAVYLTPDAMQNEVINSSSLQAWEGYQTFSYYAESETNPYEVTPNAEATGEATSDATSEATGEAEETLIPTLTPRP
jgi:hypothetical protein